MELAVLAIRLVLLDRFSFGRMGGMRRRFLVRLFAGGTQFYSLAQERTGVVLGCCFFSRF